MQVLNTQFNFGETFFDFAEWIGEWWTGSYGYQGLQFSLCRHIHNRPVNSHKSRMYSQNIGYELSKIQCAPRKLRNACVLVLFREGCMWRNYRENTTATLGLDTINQPESESEHFTGDASIDIHSPGPTIAKTNL